MSESSLKLPKHTVTQSRSEKEDSVESVSPVKRKRKKSRKKSAAKRQCVDEELRIVSKDDEHDQDKKDSLPSVTDAESLSDKSKESAQLSKAAIQEQTFYIGRLPLGFGQVRTKVEDLISKAGIEIIKIEGAEQAKFCHCIIANLADSEKMESLNNALVKGKQIVVAKSLQYKNSVKIDNHKVCLLNVDPSIVTVEALIEKTKATNATIIANQRTAILKFDDAFDAKKLTLLKNLSIGGCYMKISRPHYKPAAVESNDSVPCFNCGLIGHKATACTLPAIFGKPISTCRHCGRRGHYAKYCTAEASITGLSKCANCGGSGHRPKHCPNKPRSSNGEGNKKRKKH